MFAHQQDAVKAMLCRIAHAETQEQLDNALQALKSSSVWNSSEALRNYLTITWEPHIQVCFNIKNKYCFSLLLCKLRTTRCFGAPIL